MSIWTRIRDAWRTFTNSTAVTTYGDGAETLLQWLGIDADKDVRHEVIYFTCLRLLSETIGKMPWQYFRRTERGKIRAEPDDMTRLLDTRPNPIMTPTSFWAAAELNCQHYGNAYIWIQRHIESQRRGGRMVNDGLWLMPSTSVQVIVDDRGVFGRNAGQLYYQYTDPQTGEIHIYPQDDVIHIKTSYTFDGIMGVPVRKMIGGVLTGALANQKVMNNLYENGLMGPMALQYTVDLDDDRKKKLIEKFEGYLKAEKKSGKVIPVPPGMQLAPLKVSLSESQFAELKKYTALQIAAAFGIKPNQINDYEKSSYANAETQQLAFLVDTMAYRMKQYEEEVNYKVLSNRQLKDGYWYRLNEKAILRTDSRTQKDILTGYVQNGVYAVNEARDLLQLPHVEGGDEPMCNGNYVKLTQVGAAYGLREEGGNGDEGAES